MFASVHKLYRHEAVVLPASARQHSRVQQGLVGLVQIESCVRAPGRPTLFRCSPLGGTGTVAAPGEVPTFTAIRKSCDSAIRVPLKDLPHPRLASHEKHVAHLGYQQFHRASLTAAHQLSLVWRT
jgi:hypothetical protein